MSDLLSLQVLGLFNRTIRRLSSFLHAIVSRDVEEKMEGALQDEDAADKVKMNPLGGLDEELVSEVFNAILEYDKYGTKIAQRGKI